MCECVRVEGQKSSKKAAAEAASGDGEGPGTGTTHEAFLQYAPHRAAARGGVDEDEGKATAALT